jgi:hypothetical protein
MNARTVLSTALVLVFAGVGTARAQTPDSTAGYATLPPSIASSSSPAGAVPQQAQVSSWVRGDKYNCCDAPGGNGPIEYELFFRVGPSIQIGSGQLADSMLTGVYAGGGGRLLFFNCPATDAWILELGLANITNQSNGGPEIPITILVPPGTSVAFGQNGLPGVTVREVNRTFVNLGGGQEMYLIGSALCNGLTWRIGWDGGGRYGSESVTFNEIPHRTGVIEGTYGALHSDIEIPWGTCMAQAGFRVEYDYFWSNILQDQNKAHTQDINILFNIGIRY